LCIKCMKLRAKHFFLAEVLFLGGVILDLDKYLFPWQMGFFWGDHVRLQSSCIQVNMVLTLSSCLSRTSEFQSMHTN